MPRAAAGSRGPSRRGPGEVAEEEEQVGLAPFGAGLKDSPPWPYDRQGEKRMWMFIGGMAAGTVMTAVALHRWVRQVVRKVSQDYEQINRDRAELLGVVLEELGIKEAK